MVSWYFKFRKVQTRRSWWWHCGFSLCRVWLKRRLQRNSNLWWRSEYMQDDMVDDLDHSHVGLNWNRSNHCLPLWMFNMSDMYNMSNMWSGLWIVKEPVLVFELQYKERWWLWFNMLNMFSISILNVFLVFDISKTHK